MDRTGIIEQWAKQSKSRGKASSMSFEGPTLYSYDTAIAVLLKDGTAVIGTRKYSVTTSSHQSAVRRVLAKLGVQTREVYHIAEWESALQTLGLQRETPHYMAHDKALDMQREDLAALFV